MFTNLFLVSDKDNKEKKENDDGRVGLVENIIPTTLKLNKYSRL